MRVVSFIMILAFASTIGVAQTEQTVQTEQKKQTEYKLGKGNFTTEMQLSLFSTNAMVHYDDDDETVSYLSTGPLSLSGLRLRYAFNEKLALRFNVGFDFGHNTDKKNLDDTIRNGTYSMNVTMGTSTNKSRYTGFVIAPGIEYHFGNWERMSVYVGGEVMFGMRMTNGISELNQTIENFQRDWSTGNDDLIFAGSETTVSKLTTKNCIYNDSPYYSSHKQTGIMTFGAAVFMGMDFYVYKGLYLGAELGLGYLYASALEGTAKGNSKVVTIDRYWDVDIDEKEVNKTFKDQSSGGNLGFKCNPMIRIGWKF